MFPSDLHAAGPWTTFWGARHCRILKWSLDKLPAALKLVRWGSGRVHLSADGLPSATSLFLGLATSSQDSSVRCTSPSFKISAFYMGFNAALFPGLVREWWQQITMIIFWEWFLLWPAICLTTAAICLNTIHCLNTIDAHLSQISWWCFSNWISELQEIRSL